MARYFFKHLKHIFWRAAPDIDIIHFCIFSNRTPISNEQVNPMIVQHIHNSRFLTDPVSNKALIMDGDTIRTLLIIDDEKDMCLLLRRALRAFFGHIEFAHTLSEGVAMAARIFPDVILLDNNLPDGYGINHINAFRNDNKSVQIVMVSAMDIRFESLAAGADEFIGKPVDMAELRSIINKDSSGGN